MNEIETESERGGEDVAEDFRAQAIALERRLHELKQQFDIRLIRAEMKAEAVRAGILDLDGLKLLDLSGIVLNDEGEVENANDLITRFKKAKPWLFGMTSSSSPLTPPSALPPRQKHATEMTKEEYAAARAMLLKQRY